MVAFTRKTIKTHRSNIRRNNQPRKGIYQTIRNKTVAPAPVNNTRVVKTIVRNENETRRLRKAKRKAKEWRRIVEEINDPDILDNIGLYIDEHGKLVSSEEDVVDIQYELLIKELQHRIDPSNDPYEEKILNKAIKFVAKAREAKKHNANMNSLESMMAKL
jgi:hypothetical protein